MQIARRFYSTGGFSPLPRIDFFNPDPASNQIQLADCHALVWLLRQAVHRRLETARPPSITVVFWMLTLQIRRVAFLDQGRLFPNCGPFPHC